MKVVINRCYGGFNVPLSILEELPHDRWYYDEHRDDEDFVWAVEHSDECETKFNHSDLRVAEFSDEATDWRIQEYDGMEYILYVLNGKIEEAY